MLRRTLETTKFNRTLLIREQRKNAPRTDLRLNEIILAGDGVRKALGGPMGRDVTSSPPVRGAKFDA